MKSLLKKYRILVVSLLLLALFLGFYCLPGLRKGGSKDFRAFCTTLFKNEVTDNTMNLHFTLKDPKAAGIDSYTVTLGSLSENSPKDSGKALEKLQKELEGFSRRSLSREEKLTYDVLSDNISRQQALKAFPYYEEILSPSSGITSQLPILLAEYRFDRKQDIDDYLTLLSQMDTYFSELLSYEKKKADKGLFMSDDICMKVIAGCEFFTGHPDDNFLIDTFASRLGQVEGLSDAQKQDYIDRNKAVIADHVIPAYSQMISGLTALMGSGRNDWGLCYYPKGKAYYEAVAAYASGCDDGAESLYQQIAQARKEDLAVCAKILDKDPSLSDSSEELKGKYNDETKMLSALENSIQKDFPAPPETEWEICHVDPSLSEYLAPAFYITAPIDDYSYNRIYINDAGDYSDLYYFTTLAHEGYPGHLYQTIQSYYYGLAPVRSLLNYPGYTEGWATYVEMLSYYYAGLPRKEASLLQHNQAAVLSLYASSDIGIHYFGWKKAEMEKFWNMYGFTDSDTIENITDLILEEPGNYLKYYVGYLKFRQLRESYEQKYGDRFDACAFHEAILRTGPAPFSIVEKIVTELYP